MCASHQYHREVHSTDPNTHVNQRLEKMMTRFTCSIKHLFRCLSLSKSQLRETAERTYRRRSVADGRVVTRRTDVKVSILSTQRCHFLSLLNRVDGRNEEFESDSLISARRSIVVDGPEGPVLFDCFSKDLKIALILF